MNHKILGVAGILGIGILLGLGLFLVDWSFQMDKLQGNVETVSEDEELGNLMVVDDSFSVQSKLSLWDTLWNYLPFFDLVVEEEAEIQDHTIYPESDVEMCGEVMWESDDDGTFYFTSLYLLSSDFQNDDVSDPSDGEADWESHSASITMNQVEELCLDFEAPEETGEYDIRMQRSSGVHADVIGWDTFNVEYEPMDADVSGPSEAYVGEEVTFSGLGSDGDVDDYSWDIQGTSYSGGTVDTSFSSEGNKLVELTVTSSDGRSDTDATQISISEPDDVNAVMNIPSTVEEGQEYTLDGSSSTGVNLDYQWRIDGQQVSTSSTYDWEVQRSTDTTISLTVEDDFGETDLTEQSVSVIPEEDDSNGDDSNGDDGDSNGDDEETTPTLSASIGEIPDVEPQEPFTIGSQTSGDVSSQSWTVEKLDEEDTTDTFPIERTGSDFVSYGGFPEGEYQITFEAEDFHGNTESDTEIMIVESEGINLGGFDDITGDFTTEETGIIGIFGFLMILMIILAAILS